MSVQGRRERVTAGVRACEASVSRVTPTGRKPHASEETSRGSQPRVLCSVWTLAGVAPWCLPACSYISFWPRNREQSYRRSTASPPPWSLLKTDCKGCRMAALPTCYVMEALPVADKVDGLVVACWEQRQLRACSLAHRLRVLRVCHTVCRRHGAGGRGQRRVGVLFWKSRSWRGGERPRTQLVTG